MRKNIDSLETLHQLFESRNVCEIKVLGATLKRLISTLGGRASKLYDRDIPTRKAEIIQYILGSLDDMAVLKAIYDRLDSVDRSAVREVIDSPSSQLDLTRFRAKYGSSPALSFDVQIGAAGIRPFAWAMLLQAANLAQANGNKLGLSKSGMRARPG